MNEPNVIQALAALAQPYRLRAYRALVAAGPQGMTAGVLAERLNIAPAALTFHLKELVHATLASVTQEGRFMRYQANYNTMTELLQYMTENCCVEQPQENCCVPTPSKRLPSPTAPKNPTKHSTKESS